MRFTIIILLLFLSIGIFSCDKVKRKGHNIIDKAQGKIDKAKDKLKDKKDSLIEKVFPSYDFDTSDTESNKKRFREHLKVNISSDVNNIYAYGDFLGIDYKVLIAFTCDKATIEKIVDAKKMKRSTCKDDDGMKFSVELKWWDQDKIDMLEPYKIGKEAEYWQYLWYDPVTRQAYYEEYSL